MGRGPLTWNTAGHRSDVRVVLIPLHLVRPVHAAANKEVSQALPLKRRELQRAEGPDQLHPHRGVQQEQALGQHEVHEGEYL